MDERVYSKRKIEYFPMYFTSWSSRSGHIDHDQLIVYCLNTMENPKESLYLKIKGQQVNNIWEIFTHTHARTHAHTLTHMHTHTHTHTHAHAHTLTYTLLYTHMYTHSHTPYCTRTCTHTHILLKTFFYDLCFVWPKRVSDYLPVCTWHLNQTIQTAKQASWRERCHIQAS